MRKVMLVWTNDNTSSEDTERIVRETGVFEEISEEDYSLLTQNLYRLKRPSYGMSPQLILSGEPVQESVLLIKDQLKELQLEGTKRKEKLEKDRKNAAATKLKREKAAFLKLKEKFEGDKE